MRNYIIGAVVLIAVIYALYRVIKNSFFGKGCTDASSSCSGCSVSKSCNLREKQ